MPTTIINGQTTLTLQDLVDRLKAEDHDYYAGSPNFISPMEPALISFAKNYGGSYYVKPSQSSAPTSFSAAQTAGAFGSFYEESLPADCVDSGLRSLEVFYTGGSIVNANITLNDSEQSWDTASTNTANIFARQAGRKMRVYVPAPIASCAGLKYSQSYLRYPSLPSALIDQIDAPADDTETLYSNWKGLVQKI